jgi:hypothetical protein
MAFFLFGLTVHHTNEILAFCESCEVLGAYGVVGKDWGCKRKVYSEAKPKKKGLEVHFDG